MRTEYDRWDDAASAWLPLVRDAAAEYQKFAEGLEDAEWPDDVQPSRSLAHFEQR